MLGRAGRLAGALVDGLVVDFVTLRSVAGGIDRAVSDIERSLDDLHRHLAALTATWTGDAADAYGRAQAEWFAAAEDLRMRLAGLRDLVLTAHDNHAGAVRTNTAIWRV